MALPRFTKKAFPVAAGLIAVAVSATVLAGGPREDRLDDIPTSRIVDMMARRLDLTADQQTKIGAIVVTTKDSLKASAGEARTILERTRDSIDQVLTPEQKAKADRLKHGLVGGLGGFVRDHGPEFREELKGAGREIRLRVALAELDLSADQRTKLRDIAKDLGDRRRALVEELKPRMEALTSETETKVNDVLTTAQQAELKGRLEEMPKGPRFDGGPRGGRRHGGFGGPRADAGGPRGPDGDDMLPPPGRPGGPDRARRGEGPDDFDGPSRPDSRPERRSERGNERGARRTAQSDFPSVPPPPPGPDSIGQGRDGEDMGGPPPRRPHGDARDDRASDRSDRADRADGPNRADGSDRRFARLELPPVPAPPRPDFADEDDVAPRGGARPRFAPGDDRADQGPSRPRRDRDSDGGAPPPPRPHHPSDASFRPEAPRPAGPPTDAPRAVGSPARSGDPADEAILDLLR